MSTISAIRLEGVRESGRIDVAGADLTDQTIESVKRSRSQFYQDAAVLLDRYRRLMNHELDSAEARDVLNHTLIAPENAATLFELHWEFRVLDAYDDVEYRVWTTRRLSQRGSKTGHGSSCRTIQLGGVSRSANPSGQKTSTRTGTYNRMNEVLSRWQSLSEDLLGRGGSDLLWGGRPDIVLERYQETAAGNWELEQVFLGEVKYTQKIDYVATGLRELLEYMAFVKRTATDEYIETAADVLDSVAVKGLLFVDELDDEPPENHTEQIKIVQYPQSPGSVL